MQKFMKCPHCKGTSGFEITIELKGYQYEKYDFNGNQLGSDRNGVDDPDKFVTCMDCGKLIPTENVNIKLR